MVTGGGGPLNTEGTTSPEVSAAPQRPPFRRSFALTYGTSILAALLSLGNVVIVSRALGPAGRGEVTFLTTMAMITSQLSSLGVEEAAGNIAGARGHLRASLASNALLLAVLLGVLAVGVVAGLIAIFPAVGGDVSPELRWLALASVPVLIMSVYLQFIIRADYGFGVTNAVLLFAPVLNVVVNGTFWAAGVISVETAVITWVVGQLIAAVGLGIYLVRRLAGFGRVNGRLAAEMVGFGAKAHPGRVMKTGNYRLDQWILGSIAGSKELGLYSVAVAWTEALFFLPEALSIVLRPDLVRASKREAGRQAGAVFRLALLVTIPFVVAVVVAAPLLCVTIFGSAFSGSVDDLRVLAPGALGIVALKLLANALVAQGRPLLSNAAIAVAFAVTIALDIVLIPPYGGVGAAIASLAAYTSGGLVVTIIFARTLELRWRDLVPGGDDLRQLADAVRRSR
jgi:O-antigen/teichoic acid export membrane protein